MVLGVGTQVEAHRGARRLIVVICTWTIDLCVGECTGGTAGVKRHAIVAISRDAQRWSPPFAASRHTVVV